MQGRKLVAASAAREEITLALSVYTSNLLSVMKKEIGLGSKEMRVEVSPCGGYVLCGLFDPGLAPHDDGDMWDFRPGDIMDKKIAVVGGSDIFILKRNEKGAWGKFAGKRDAAKICRLIVEG